MAQIFHPSTNVISKLSIVAVAVLVPLLGVAGYAFNMTYGIDRHVPLEQPIQFSHKHHVTDDGIDCRYCHSSVDKSNNAGMPATEVCMTCHSQIWKESPLIRPIQESYRANKPIQWTRVHDLPDFAYFNHSIHVRKGVSCVSCHGRVDEMPITWKEKELSMAWCLDCHRNPQKVLRPRDKVYNLAWKPEGDQETLGKELIQKYHVLSELQLSSCSTCHH
jgi:hypothetical protein